MLRNTQKDFKDAVLNKDFSSAANDIKPKRDIDPIDLIQIHLNNSMKSLTKVLRSAFPVTEQIVGEQFFTAAAYKFIQENPPQSGCLTYFGGDFPAFLAEFEPAKSLKYLPDVARLEWAWQHAYHAVDEKAIDLKDLIKVDSARQGNIHLKFNNSITLIYSPYAIDTIWERHKQGFVDEESEEIDVEDHAAYMMVARPRWEVIVRTLDVTSYVFLEKLKKGGSLIEATDAALQIEPRFNLQKNLATFFADGLFTHYYLKEE